MTTPIETATDRFLDGLSAICDRLYAEARANGATEAQAERAVKLTLIDYMTRKTAEAAADTDRGCLSRIVCYDGRSRRCELPAGHIGRHQVGALQATR